MGNNKFRYILFDLDGTITDSGPGIMNASRYALESFGIDEKDEARLRLFVGPPLDESFMERYGFDREKAIKAVEKFREYYNVTGIYENSVYDGMEELLKTLKDNGKTVAIASSKPQIMVHRVLENFGISGYFDVIVGCELDGRRSSKDEVIDEVIRQLGFERDSLPDDMVMVGDRCYDVTGAEALGLPCIAVLYGYGTREELEGAGAAAIAETVAELGDFLLDNGNK